MAIKSGVQLRPFISNSIAKVVPVIPLRAHLYFPISPCALGYRQFSIYMGRKKPLPVPSIHKSKLIRIFAAAMVYLTRREYFNGAHKLYVADWSPEKNAEVFGKCANKHFHGHNFDVYVTVKGAPDPVTGFIMNAHTLSKIMKREIVDRLDHKNFNLDVPEFKNKMGTCENVAIQIWKWLEPHIEGCQLHCVKLIETENIYVEYFGEGNY